MTDVFHDHIRFQGYHVPIDLSGLPPTKRDALVNDLNDAIDARDGFDEAVEASSERAARNASREVIDAVRNAIRLNKSDADRIKAVSRLIERMANDE